MSASSTEGRALHHGATVGGPFALTDHHHRPVTDLTFRGRHMLVFFGFTHCRSVCPRVLARLSRVLDELGAAADRIQPLYVTVDPQRDRPEVMRAFLHERYPRFLGLTGDPDGIARMTSAYRVFSRRAEDPEDADGYAMPHTALTYLIGPDGRYITHFADALAEDQLRARLANALLA